MDNSDDREGFRQIKGRAEEFLQLFKKGEEFTAELLRENEKLRFKLLQLEEESNRMKKSGPGRLGELEEKVAVLEEENRRLMQRFLAVEVENKNFAEKYLEVEAENNTLANLYVASYQLHSTLDFGEVLRTVLEIIINLVGAEKFAIMLLDEKTGEILPVASEGVALEDVPPVTLGSGVIGGAAKSGESYFADPRDIPDNGSLRPIVCIPLKIKEHVIGVMAIYSLLVQKKSFTDIDYELFSMLAGHAATAIFSSRLYSQSERKLVTIQSFLDLIKEKSSAD